MNIEKFSIIYEEINEKNKVFVEHLEKNKYLDIGLVSFYLEDSDDITDYCIVKRCKRRNVCRIYALENNSFKEEDWLPYICSAALGFLPADCIIWYCAEDYIIALGCGFGDPYFCNCDPFGESVSETVAVCKINDPDFQTNLRKRYTGNDTDPTIFQSRRISPTIENNSLFDFCRKNMDTDDPIELKIRFDIEDLNYLRSLVFGGRTVNEDGTTTQKEVSGTMFLDYNGRDFDLKIDKSKNFNAHDEEKVRFVNGLINFHTHPLDVYNSYNVELMYPSPTDYVSILTFLMQRHCFEERSKLISPLLFSCVVTVEGIYIISLNKNYCNQKDRDYLREMICDNKGEFYDIKQSVKDGINSKVNGVSGYFYGKNRSVKEFYDTHCKYVGDPFDHPLGCSQVGGFDYDTFRHNRKESDLLHFPPILEKCGFKYTRVEQAAKDYCIKINQRQLVSGTKFRKGPVLNVEYMTYEELETKHFKISTSNMKSKIMPKQLFLSQETLDNIRVFFNHSKN